MPGKGTIDAIFIARQVQEKVLGKKKDLYFIFVDLKKIFGRVLWKVLDWALQRVGSEERIIKAVMAMSKNAKSGVNISNGSIREAFDVKVCVHQGSA